MSTYNQTYPFEKNTKAHKAYNKEILKKFGKYKEHDFIKLTNKIIATFDFYYEEPIDIALQNYKEHIELVKKLCLMSPQK